MRNMIATLTLTMLVSVSAYADTTYRAVMLPVGFQSNDINDNAVAGYVKNTPSRGVIFTLAGDTPSMQYFCTTQNDTVITVLPEDGQKALGQYSDANGRWAGGVFPLFGSQGPSEYNPGPYIRPIIPLATSQRSGLARGPEPPVTQTGIVPLNNGSTGVVYRSDSLGGFEWFQLPGYSQVTGYSTCAAEDGRVGVNADNGHAYVWSKSQIDDLGPNAQIKGMETVDSQYRVGQKSGYATLWVGTTAYTIEISGGSYANWMQSGVIVGYSPLGAFVSYLDLAHSRVQGYYLGDITQGLPSGTKIVTATRVAYNGRIMAECLVPGPYGPVDQWAVLTPTIPPPL